MSKETKSSKRLYRYDNLRFILILLVVVGHFAEEYTPESHLMTSIWIFIYAFHMPIFIFLFGLFSKRTILYPKYPGEKIYTYIFLYMIYKITLYWVKIFCGKSPDFDLLSELEIPWFMLSCASFLLIARFLKNNTASKMIVTISLALSCIIGYWEEIGDFLCLSRTITFLPFFLLGYYLDISAIEKAVTSKKILSVS